MRIRLLHCVGLLVVLLSLFSVSAHAAPTDSTQNGSVGIEGTVPSNAPTVGATITTPTTGQSFTELPVVVSGLCTGDVLVKLFKNEVFAGSAQCSNGSYSITIDLFEGTNDLIARVYDALDQAGPDSNTVTVTFHDTVFAAIGTRISVTSNYAKRGANPKETFTYPIIISGGEAPFAVSVDWGDGKTDLISREFAGAFDITHIYNAPGIYNILIKATDTTGASAFLQVVGIANGALSQDGTTSKSTTTANSSAAMWVPLALTAPLIFLTFWLGRMHQLRSLRKEAEKRIQY